jgi:hypothetical protein
LEEFRDTPLGENESEFYFSLRPTAPNGGGTLTELPTVVRNQTSNEPEGSRMAPPVRSPRRQESP